MPFSPMHERVYRALLRLLPSSFRPEFGNSMVEDFHDQRDETAARGSSRVRAFWMNTIGGLRTTASEAGLAGPALHILLALGQDAKHGYAIMRDIEERSGGAIRLLPGTLYSTMKKLLDEGLVEECSPPKDAERDDACRRYYRVTRPGKTAVRRERERLALLVELGQVFG